MCKGGDDAGKKTWEWLRPFRFPRSLSTSTGPKLVILHSLLAWVFRIP